MNAKSLPTAREAEGQVVGAILLEPALVPKTAKQLRPDDFTDPCHRATFDTLQTMNRTGVPIDVVTLKQELDSKAVFNGSTTAAVYLAETGQAVTTTAHCDYYAGLVVEAARKRRIHGVATAAAEAACNGQASSEILADLGAGVEDLRRDECTAEKFQAIDGKQLDSSDFSLNYIVDFLLVAEQPCILAGPKKGLKTSLLCDLGISISTGGEFLGKFQVSNARRFLLCSGESGLATLQETCRRVAESKGWRLADVPNFAISPDLPRLDLPENLAIFEEFLERQEAKVLGVDPAYLCMPGADAGNLFVQGTMLRDLSELCRRQGVTLVLAHHTKKSVADLFAVPELDAIAWSGFAEFARQWLLLGRRELYEPGSGEHRLWLSVGGSAGHGGLWAIDVNEGTNQDAMGRHWDVDVSNASEACQRAEQRKADERRQRLNEQLEADVKALVDAIAKLAKQEGTKTDLKDATGLNETRFRPALAAAIKAGHLVPTKIRKGNNRTYDGFQLGGCNG